MKIPDASRFMERQQTQVDKGLDLAQSIFAKYEADAADLEGVKAGSEYEVWKKTELRKLQEWDGDPAPVFAKHDEADAAKRAEIMAQYEGAGDRVKRAVEQRVLKKTYELADTAGVQQATQYQKYEKITTDAAVKLEREGAALASTLIDGTKDPKTGKLLNLKSFDKFDERMNEMTKLLVESGRRRGLVREDQAEPYSPSLMFEIKKNRSDAVKDAVLTLNGDGKTEAADELMERYKTDLLAEDKIKLQAHGSAAKTRVAAAGLNERFKHIKDPVQAIQAIEKAAGDPLVAQEAVKMRDLNDQRVERAEKRVSKDVFETMAKQIRQGQRNDTAPLTWDEFEKGEMFSRMGDKLDESHVRTLKRLFDNRTSSDPAAKRQVVEALADDSLRDMTFDEKEKIISKMTRADAEKFETKWVDATSDTPSERHRNLGYLSDRLRAQMMQAGLIKKTEYGRWSTKSENAFNAAYDKMMKYVDRIGPSPRDSELNEWAQKFVSDMKKGQAFAPPERDRFRGNNRKPPPEPPPGAPQPGAAAPVQPPAAAPSGKTTMYRDLPQDQRNELLAKWRQAKGHALQASEMAEFKKFIEKGGKL
jgi:hypothetical protein